MMRTLLHVATDWPGRFPNGPVVVAALVAAGAEVNDRFTGPHGETRLRWAASSDAVAVLDALIAGSADLEAHASVIDGGAPLADAVAFGQWNAARRLIEHGAQATCGRPPGWGCSTASSGTWPPTRRPAPRRSPAPCGQRVAAASGRLRSTCWSAAAS
jgi:hypothetical protein